MIKESKDTTNKITKAKMKIGIKIIFESNEIIFSVLK